MIDWLSLWLEANLRHILGKKEVKSALIVGFCRKVQKSSKKSAKNLVISKKSSNFAFENIAGWSSGSSLGS